MVFQTSMAMLDNLFAIVRVIMASIMLLCGILLFFMGPRLVYHIVRTAGQTQFGKSFLHRWAHLFFLETLAGIFCCSGLTLIGALAAISLLQVAGIVVGLAFITSCVLSSYI